MNPQSGSVFIVQQGTEGQALFTPLMGTKGFNVSRCCVLTMQLKISLYFLTDITVHMPHPLPFILAFILLLYLPFSVPFLCLSEQETYPRFPSTAERGFYVGNGKLIFLCT